MQITRQTIRYSESRDGTIYKKILGYVHPALPGLAVAPRIRYTDKGGWALIHIPSGLPCRFIKNHKVAILTLEYLADISAEIDWTLDYDNLLRAYPRHNLLSIVDKAIADARRGRLRQGFLFAA